MAVQLILKNSSVEDKRPTSAQLAIGEISLNYNQEGAFLCCEDSAGNIQQIGGVKIDETAPSTPVKQSLWFKPSTLVLSIYDGSNWQAVGNATVASVNGQTGAVVLTAADVGAATAAQGVLADSALQSGDDISHLNNDSNYLASGDNISELANNSGYIVAADVAGEYLSLDSAAGAQVVQSTSTTEFKGGLLVPDGEPITVTDSTTSCSLAVTSADTATLTASDKLIVSTQDGITNQGIFSGESTLKFIAKSTAPWSTTNQDYVFLYPRIDDSVEFNESDPATYVDNFSCVTASIYYGDPGVNDPNIRNKYGLKINSAVGQSTWTGAAASSNYGVYSNLSLTSPSSNYNFYAASNATNFFAGNTLIGGTAAAPAITLAANGEATFAGNNITITASGNYFTNSNVYAGTNPSLGSAPGSGLASTGAVMGTALGSSNVWEGRDTATGLTKTSLIKADGSAEFAGDVTIADKIIHNGDTNTAIRFPAIDTVSVETSGSERLRIDSSGNVGINNANPSELLSLEEDGPLGIELKRTGSSPSTCLMRNQSNQFTLSNDAGGIDFSTGATPVEVVRITSSGNLQVGGTLPSAPAIEFEATGGASFTDSVGIGTNSPESRLHVSGGFNSHIRMTNTGDDVLDLIGDANRSGTNQKLLEIKGLWNGTKVSSINFKTGTDTTNKDDGYLTFSTATAGSVTERMRLDRSGLMNVKSDGAIQAEFGVIDGVYRSGENTIRVYGNASDNYVQLKGTNVADGTAVLDSKVGGTAQIQIQADGDVFNINGTYGQLSDQKLKENIVDANSQWEDIKALTVRNFNFKKELGYNANRQIGFVAQEVEKISPGLVKTKADIDEDGNDLGTETKAIRMSVLYVKAVKALQEAMERIETLEQRLLDAGIS